MTLEERVSRLEGVVEQVNERLGALERGMEDLRAEMRELRVEMRSQFRWTMGVALGMWVSVIATVLGALLTR